MAFVNEYIPAEDYDNYGLNNIDRINKGYARKSRSWTIDRERDVYLRHIATPAKAGYSIWCFYWKGTLLYFHQTSPYGSSTLGEDGRRYARSAIEILEFPSILETNRQEIYNDMRDAFLTYGGGGVNSQSNNYINQIEFKDEGGES